MYLTTFMTGECASLRILAFTVGGWISTWLPVYEEQSDKTQTESPSHPHPRVTAAAFISPGKTTQKIKRDTLMTYERWGIPPSYMHVRIYLYKYRGSNHTCKHFYYWKENVQRYQTFYSRLFLGKFPNSQATFQHRHGFNSRQVPLLLLSLFCLCIDVDASFLSKSTMVSCCHCFAIRVCSYVLMFAYFQFWASVRWQDESPLKQIHWHSTAVCEGNSCPCVRFEVY